MADRLHRCTSTTSTALLAPNETDTVNEVPHVNGHRSYGTSVSRRSSTSLNTSSSDTVALEETSSRTGSSLNLALLHHRLSASQENRYIHDQDRLRIYRAAEEAGLSSFGIIAVDVWYIGGETGSTNPLARNQILHTGVLWTSPQFSQQNQSEALDRLVNPNHPRYVKPLPQVAGAGLAGYFYSLGKSRDSNGGLIWRNLSDIISDPFQPPYERMLVWNEAGFGKVTGITFHAADGHQGVVLYFARSRANETLLNEPTNVEFLSMATQYIGMTSALCRSRQLSIRNKSRNTHRIWKRVKTKLFCYRAFVSLSHQKRSLRRHNSFQTLVHGLSFRSWDRTSSESSFIKLSMRQGIVEPLIVLNNSAQLGIWWLGDELKYRISSVVEKSKGSSIRPPPVVPWLNATWTFAGVYITLLLLVSINPLILKKFELPNLLLAPFGALLTLQYSLTAAPVSQPRNILYGLFVCMSVTLLCQGLLLHHFGVSKELVLPLAGALGIAIMAKLGVSHPPAAAAMVALLDMYDPVSSSLLKTLTLAALLVIANLLTILSSIVINNLSDQRQYPMYWAMGIGTTTGRRAGQHNDVLGRERSLVRHAKMIPITTTTKVHDEWTLPLVQDHISN